MKEVKHWVCEICGTEYKDKDTAENCEKCHKIPIAITNQRYVSKLQNGAGYPVALEIQMSDGTFQTYKR